MMIPRVLTCPWSAVVRIGLAVAHAQHTLSRCSGLLSYELSGYMQNQVLGLWLVFFVF